MSKHNNEIQNLKVKYDNCCDDRLLLTKQLKNAKHYKTWHDILKLDYKKLESKADTYLKQLEQANNIIDEIKQMKSHSDFTKDGFMKLISILSKYNTTKLTDSSTSEIKSCEESV